MEERIDCCGGIDVHKKLLVAFTRRGEESTIRKCGTATTDIRDRAQWITDNQCQLTVMASTGSYWISVWNVFKELNVLVVLANAARVKAVPEKKDGQR